MEQTEHVKGKVFAIRKVAEYMPHTTVLSTIIKKTTGNVTLMALDTGEILREKTSPFDVFIHVIDGNAEIHINEFTHKLGNGEAIIIPAHSRSAIKANKKVKMISTVIKSGYEEVS